MAWGCVVLGGWAVFVIAVQRRVGWGSGLSGVRWCGGRVVWSGGHTGWLVRWWGRWWRRGGEVKGRFVGYVDYASRLPDDVRLAELCYTSTQPSSLLRPPLPPSPPNTFPTPPLQPSLPPPPLPPSPLIAQRPCQLQLNFFKHLLDNFTH